MAQPPRTSQVTAIGLAVAFFAVIVAVIVYALLR
jgi:hypothetical protein